MPFTNIEERREYHRQWYQKHRTRVLQEKKDWARHNHEELRRALLEKLGGKCKVCGFDDWRALQLDHINGDGAAERRNLGRSGFQATTLRRMLRNPDAYRHLQVLCANHNWIKRYVNNETRLGRPPQSTNPSHPL